MVGLSTLADDGREEGERCGSDLVRMRMGGAVWPSNAEGERAVPEMAGSSPAASVELAGFGGVGRLGGISGSWAE